jgi:hypothetical protein
VDIGSGIWAEAHMSANNISKSIRLVLQTFRVDPSEMVIYLRQDRDAEEDAV